ncbi:MAG: hypothetical protein ACI8QD_000482 [Cyclobacteriaceae bacterium]|jgi:hypothetical protein
MKGIHLLLPLLLFSSWSYAQNNWTAGTGTWSTGANWSGGVPADGDNVIIDCVSACTVTMTANIGLDIQLYIGSQVTLDVAFKTFAIGAGDVTSSVTNYGTILKVKDFKIKGAGTYGQGPTLNNYGTITQVDKLSIGNNNGGGIIINHAGATISVTIEAAAASKGDAHIDGQLTNDGTISVEDEFLLHGGILAGTGNLEAGYIMMKDNPMEGAAGAGSGGIITGGSISDPSGSCSGSTDGSLLYVVPSSTEPTCQAAPGCTFSVLMGADGTGDSTDYYINSSTSSCGESGFVTLPVELLDFSSKSTAQGIELNWSTATESFNSHFEIEKSRDGTSFTSIGIVNGHGTSAEVQTYRYMDREVTSSYYRLKQVDFDGTAAYHEIIKSDDMNFGLFDTNFYPNPATDRVTINLAGFVFATSAEFQLFDLQGQLIKSAVLTSPFTEINLNGLRPGLYIVQTNYLKEKSIDRLLIK